MAKRITAKVGEYEKDGQKKGKYVDVGVILSSENGEFILLNPTIDLSGVLMKQRLMNPNKAGDSVMCSIFDNSQQRSQPAPASDDPNDSIPF